MMAITVFFGDLSDFEIFEVNTIVDDSEPSPAANSVLICAGHRRIAIPNNPNDAEMDKRDERVNFADEYCRPLRRLRSLRIEQLDRDQIARRRISKQLNDACGVSAQDSDLPQPPEVSNVISRPPIAHRGKRI
jgi:hypothetical protein